MDETRSFGEGFADENLSLWPVYSRESGDLGHLVTRHSAQASGQAAIRERGGLVPACGASLARCSDSPS